MHPCWLRYNQPLRCKPLINGYAVTIGAGFHQTKKPIDRGRVARPGAAAARRRGPCGIFSRLVCRSVDGGETPPLQRSRTPAKVDALMALCDQLEASLNAAAATRGRLLDALLADALAPAEPAVLDMAG
jgi:hypothetical protein